MELLMLPWPRRGLSRMMGALLAMSCAGALFAEPSRPSEYEVKAAFLYNFARFAQWPPSRASERNVFRICVLGADPFGSAFDAISGRQAKGLDLRISRHRAISEISDCDILFVSSSEGARVREIVRSLTAAVLTVSDTEGFAQQGGMINFVVREKKIRFQINVDAAERAGIKISSKLLRLADVIRDEG